MKVITYLNRVIISINEYGNYNFKKVFYNWTIIELLKKNKKNDKKNKQDSRWTLRFRWTVRSYWISEDDVIETEELYSPQFVDLDLFGSDRRRNIFW